MYLESKVRYLWYLDVVEIADKFSSQQPTRVSLAEAVTQALRLPRTKTT
jgi:hypothetical protein